jgi:hypothetical protein
MNARTRVPLLALAASVLALSALERPSLANVFTHDAREAVTGAELMSASPSRYSGRISMPDGQWCSGTLVYRDLVVTAAHCLFDPITHRRLQGEFKFYLGYENGRFAAKARVTRFWHGKTDPMRFDGGDWAILRLDEPLGARYGWIGVVGAKPSALMSQFGLASDAELSVVAYSKDFRGGKVASLERGCHFRGEFEPSGGTMLLHDCSQTGGSSGAALYGRGVDARGKTVYRVVAINVAGIAAGGTSNYGDPIPFGQDQANLAVPATQFLGLLQAIIAQDKVAR